MPNQYGLPEGPLSAWLGVRDSNARMGLLDTQNATGLMGILAHVQAAQKQRETEARQQQLDTLLKANGGDLEKLVPQLSQSREGIALLGHLAPVLKLQQESKLMEPLGSADKMTPEQLDALGQRLALGGHPGAATVMNIADKRRLITQNQDAMTGMQSAPERPAIAPQTLSPELSGPPSPAIPAVPAKAGVADFLINSQFPMIANAAKNLQSRIDQGGAGLTPAMIDSQLNRLTTLHQSEQSKIDASTRNQNSKIDFKVMFPPAGDLAGQTPMEELTPAGQKVKNDLIRSGMAIPKTRRGLVDNSALNSLGAENEAGAAPVSVDKAEYKAKSAALQQNSKDLTAIRPYNNMLEQNANIAIDLANKAVKTDLRLANKSLNWLRQNAGDNPDVAEFLAQTRIVSTEAARVLNNPRLVGQLTDSARHEMDGIVSGEMPLNSFTRVIRRMQSDGRNRVGAMTKEHDDLLKSLGGRVPAAEPAPAAPPARRATDNSTGWKVERVTP